MKTQSIFLFLGILCLSIMSCTTPTTEEPPAPDLAQIKTSNNAANVYAA